jgi:hypothetical protein
MSISCRRLLATSATLAALPLADASRAAVRRVPDAPLVLDDASGLNATPISRQASFNSAKDGLLEDLRAMLADAAAKRHHDPQLRFRNALWDAYLA